MTPSNDREWPPEARRLYDAALDARHAGKLDEALSLGAEALRATEHTYTLARTAIQGEMGHVQMLRGDHVAAEVHFRAATKSLPRSELASLALFHTLLELSETEAALQEAIRFLGLRSSSDYADMFRDGFQDDLDGELRRLADEARRLLGVHQSAKAE